MIEKAPTVDAVPVVRCRDCKYGGRVYEDRDDYDCRMMLVLPWWFKEDYFCAYGIRKDDANERLCEAPPAGT